MEEQKETVHKRRVRYKGKYPKKFEEKWRMFRIETKKSGLPAVFCVRNYSLVVTN